MIGISPEQIVEATIAYCEEADVQIPEQFKTDFLRHLGDVGTISTVRQLTYKICKAIEELLETNREERKKYGKWFRSIQEGARWRVVLAIKETTASLEAFLADLPEGQVWDTDDLRHWELKGEKRGEEIYALTHRERGQFTLKEIKEILGKKAKKLLKRNPFKKFEYIERNMEWAKEVLKEFLKTLKSGEKWYQEKLVRWKGHGSRNGANLRNWINKHRPAWDEQAVAEILGDEASALLRRNSFTKKEMIEWSDQRATEALRWYVSQLPPNQAWYTEDLRRWKEKGGVAVGNRLFHWIINRYGKIDRDVVIAILYPQAERLLSRNPFRKREKGTWTKEEVVRHLTEYLNTLSEGETWNMRTLDSWKKDENKLGERLYRILYERAKKTAGALTAEAMKDFLGEYGDTLLRRNPFTKQKKCPEWNVGRARTAIKHYLSTLEEGQTWNPNAFRDWTEKGEKIGRNLYAWMRKTKGGMNETVVREIFGNQADKLLRRNQFQYQNQKRAA